MPAQLPPPVVPVATPWGEPPDAARALGPQNPLEAAYRQAVRALGVHCVGATLVTVDGPVPVGLKAFLDRHNPALAQAALAASPAPLAAPSPRFITAERVQAGELEASDRQVLAWLVQEGLLESMPTYGVADVGANGGLTRTEWGFPELTRIAIDANPMPVFRLGDIGLQDRVDPVLFRWMVVLHEAGHAQMAHDMAPFTLPGLTPDERTLVNQVMRGPAAVPDNLAQVFGESYADAFAALSLLRLTHASPAARQAVESFRQGRVHLSAQKAAEHAFDVDDTSPTLNRLCADLWDRPDRLAAVSSATPAQLRVWAGRYASAGVHQWALDWEAAHPNAPVFAVGWVFPDVSTTLTPQQKDEVTQAFAVVLDQKVEAYGRQRLIAYLQAGAHGQVKPPQTDGDPLLEVLARADDHLRDLFEKTGGDPGHQKAALLLRAPVFPGDGAKVIADAFDQLPEVRKVLSAMQMTAGLLLDDPVFTANEGRHQLERVERARQALLRPLPTQDLWDTPAPAAVAIAPTSLRRRRF